MARARTESTCTQYTESNIRRRSMLFTTYVHPQDDTDLCILLSHDAHNSHADSMQVMQWNINLKMS